MLQRAERAPLGACVCSACRARAAVQRATEDASSSAPHGRLAIGERAARLKGRALFTRREQYRLGGLDVRTARQIEERDAQAVVLIARTIAGHDGPDGCVCLLSECHGSQHLHAFVEGLALDAQLIDPCAFSDLRPRVSTERT